MISTRHSAPNPDGGWLTSEVIQTLWLKPAERTPWEPQLVVETWRGGLLGGPSSTTRTVYNRGYR